MSEERLDLTQMEDSIPAKDRVIAWPRMGRIDIPLKALLLNLGAKIVIPPANSNEALEIGVKNSIEGICLPYKLNLANYIMMKGITFMPVSQVKSKNTLKGTP